jgi:hypothetical protein
MLGVSHQHLSHIIPPYSMLLALKSLKSSLRLQMMFMGPLLDSCMDHIVEFIGYSRIFLVSPFQQTLVSSREGLDA